MTGGHYYPQHSAGFCFTTPEFRDELFQPAQLFFAPAPQTLVAMTQRLKKRAGEECERRIPSRAAKKSRAAQGPSPASSPWQGEEINSQSMTRKIRGASIETGTINNASSRNLSNRALRVLRVNSARIFV